jgi:hypothetical protein
VLCLPLPAISACVLVLGAPFTCAAPLPPTKEPLQLSLTVDRDTYYEWEPIFAELVLTNRDPRPVTLSTSGVGQSRWFEYTDVRGQTLTLDYGATDCGRHPPTSKLDQFQSVRTWIDLQHAFVHVPPRPWLAEPGTYTMRGYCRCAFSFEGVDGLKRAQEVVIASPAVVFKIVRPAGVQKEALDFIRRTITEQVTPEAPKDPKDPQSGRAAQKETEDTIRGRMDSWRRHLRKLPELIELTKGERYGAAALYQYDPARCYVSPAATPQMKGLCAFKLYAYGGYADRKADQEKERRRWAEVLVKEYPNADVAIGAKTYLDKLPKPDK